MDLSDNLDQGDETISLSDVLVARDSCLPEDELWALCRECCLVLEVVNNSPEQFQTLCVTPDTVAFDQVGNVCFLDLDVDPDPIYLPPEYSNNGNPYTAHLFSLGMTLLYAAEYNVDHNKEKISPELHDLLGRMTADSTTLRPDLESTIILCEEQLCGQSSQEVCCGIAAIAGFGLPQEDHYDDTVATGSYATEHDEFSQLESYVHSDQADTTCCDDIPDITEDVSQVESLPWSEEESLLVTGTFESTLEESIAINDDSVMENRKRRRVSPQTGSSSWGLNEGQSKNSDVNKSKEDNMKKQKPALPKKPDSLTNVVDIKMSEGDKIKGAVGDLVVSELHSESDTDHSRIDSDKTSNINTKTQKINNSNSSTKPNNSDKSDNKTKTKEKNVSNSSTKDATLDKNQNISKPNGNVKTESDAQNESTRKLSTQSSVNDEKKITDSGKSSVETTSLKNKRNRRKQGMTVADILDSLDRNLTEEELWALCKEGTAALQRKKKHLPAYLSPDTLLIRESGNISFKAIPEEKPLEVIFMAPELQSKGELTEKTCLYGLSVTLRCAAGKKYSPFSSLSVSQDLRELLTFLAESNPAKRPELTDISKICSQHSNGTSSDTVCARVFQDAYKAMTEKEEKITEPVKEEIQVPAQQEKVTSKPAGSTDTNLAKPSAFKPTVGTGGFQPIKPAPIGTNGGGAFCPVPKKLPEVPEPRIPSAFSSPATHFKPIILQQTEKATTEKLDSVKEVESKTKETTSEKPKTNTTKENKETASPKKVSPSDNPHDSDKEVVKKLKELKKNLMKHRQPTMAKEIENEDKQSDSSKSAKSSSSKRSLPSTQKSSSKSEKSPKKSASNDALESLLKEIQKQGNAPDTQTLASTIAQYLKGQMGGQGQVSEGQVQPNVDTKSESAADSSVELDMTVTSGQAQLSQGQLLPGLPSQLHSQLLGQTMSLPLQQYGGNMITLPQFQFQQDPVTGLLQLTPVMPLRPVSVHSNSGSGRSNSNVDFTSPIGTSSVVREGPSPHAAHSIHNQSDISNASAISDPTGSKLKPGLHGRTAKDLVQKTANLRAKNLSRPSPLMESSKDNNGLHKWKSDHALNRSDLSFYTDEDQTRTKPGSSLSGKLPAGYVYDDTYIGSHRHPHPALSVQNEQFTNGINNNRVNDGRHRTHSNSSSPSPSKDSGVSGMNFIGVKAHPSADVSLMDRLLNSNTNVKQQRILGKIVHLLREEFAFDGYMENGVEDLAMAEYIASLGILKWETFTSAISEKYSDLYWGTELLANLYNAVNGNRPTSAKSRKPPVPRKSSHRQNDDDDSCLSDNNNNSREKTPNQLQPNNSGHRRPHSSFVPRTNNGNETSDSTDNEHYDKKRKRKSKPELDKSKSSSSNDLLDGTGPFELVPKLNVPEDTNSITTVKPVYRTGDNLDNIQMLNTNNLSLPPNNALINRQNSVDSALNNRNNPSVPKTLSSSFDGRPPNMANQNRNVNGSQYGQKLNGVSSGRHGVQNRDPTGLSREVSTSSHSSSQSDMTRESDALPVDKKGHVVYHWAMIQLCMTPEIERFMQDIDEENSQMLHAKLSSLEQQLKMERRLRKKTQRYYKNLVEQNKNPLEIGRPDKTSKAERNQLSQVAKDITEMNQRIRFIDLCKTHIQMLLAELQGIDVSYLYSIAVCPSEEPLRLNPRPDNPLLQFQNLREAQTGCEIQALHAGTPDGLMAYLFASTALSEGFIHQFFFCYRYFTSAEDVLNFLISRYISATKVLSLKLKHRAGSTETNISRLQHRVIDLLHFWVEGYYSIDFQGRQNLVNFLRNFIRDHIKEDSETGQSLLALLSNCSTGNNLELSSADPEESEMHFWQKEGTKLKQTEKSEKKSEWDSFKSLVRGKSSAKDKAGKVKISAVVVERRRRSAGSQDILPMSVSSRRNDSFMLGDYTSLCLAEQLCLIEQGIFQLTHPVHYLDSKSKGIGVAMTMKATRTPAVTRRSVFEESSSLFIEPVLDSSAVQKMIDHSEEVSHWVSAEIVSCSNPKTQVTVLSKFIFIAHTCVELRNYATAMAILDGLENLIIKQLPAWKHLPAKCTSIMEQLEATRMFLKNDPLSLMQQDKDCYLYPTIPSAVLFLLHIQQSEIGGFKLANQMFKWGKIRSIAQIIDQIRVFREHIYGFEADHTVQDTLRQRMTEMLDQDITTLASQNEMNFQKVSSGSGISGAFKKMRGKLK